MSDCDLGNATGRCRKCVSSVEVSNIKPFHGLAYVLQSIATGHETRIAEDFSITR